MSTNKNNQQKIIQEQAEKISRLENRFIGWFVFHLKFD
jgi:hypothetical protein